MCARAKSVAGRRSVYVNFDFWMFQVRPDDDKGRTEIAKWTDTFVVSKFTEYYWYWVWVFDKRGEKHEKRIKNTYVN